MGYTNIAANLGDGSTNLSEMGSYVLDRLTWNFDTLNALHRNNWIAKAIIEKPANEMIKNGFEIHSQIDPEKTQDIMTVWQRTRTRARFLECLKWARLYGGAMLIPLIDGQEDLSEPLDYSTIMPGDYKGCYVVDRWSGVSPGPELVSDVSDPDFGDPDTYIVSDNTSGKSVTIHHSRVIKIVGRELPYQERVAENYWGASELEHVFTEIRRRDDTAANIAYLIFLANSRIVKVDDLTQFITIGDQEALSAIYGTLRDINRLMSNTGLYVIDSSQQVDSQSYTFTGIKDMYELFCADVAGAAEIPIDKLFGRAPTGFNSGEETLQNYYDTLQEKQETLARPPLEKLLKIITVSTLGELPDDFEVVFNPIRKMTDTEKADLGVKLSTPILQAVDSGIISRAVALRELREQSQKTGLWTNITDNLIKEAEQEESVEETERAAQRRALTEAATVEPGPSSQAWGDTLGV